MCKAQERPQRRHRAVYLAPSVGTLPHPQRPGGVTAPLVVGGGLPSHPQQQQPLRFPSPPVSLEDLGIPLLLEVPVSAPMTVSPPSSGELSPIEFQQLQQQHQQLQQLSPHRSWKQQVYDALVGMYHGFVDLVLLLVVCLMGCFFYDVEVKVVKADRRRTRARHRSGRVVIQTNQQHQYQQQQQQQQYHHHQQQQYQLQPRGVTTSLLRTPPRSGRSSRSPTGRDDSMWEHIV